MPYTDIQVAEVADNIETTASVLEMNIERDFQHVEDKEEYVPKLTLDEAFAADDRINTIEQLAKITQKMWKKDGMGEKGERDLPVFIAGVQFSRGEVERWLITQEFVNEEDDGANAPDSSLEADMKVFNVTKYISLGDLVSTLKGANMTLQSLDGEELKEVLWHMGLDTKAFKVQELTDTHRDMNEKAVTCLRFISEERSDAPWLRSGQATFEAQVAAKGDESLQRELESIGRR